MIVRRPDWPVGRLATFELRDYRTDLEHALQVTDEHAAAYADLRTQLDQVLAEQRERLTLSFQRGWRAERRA
ncbi:MAG: hypothetical protein JO345_14580 [Streptosporangiaceae bacterium]|nr:hypothetical protein [Streptosporangiaceae bacterium]